MRAVLLLASVVAALGLAPFHPAPVGAAVPGQYIVVFSRNATQSQIDKHLSATAGVKNTYDIAGTFRGYSAKFSDSQLQAARNDEAVAYIEGDQVVHAIACTSQQNAEWNLDRTSARTPPDMSGIFRYDDATRTGKDVNVYIIDTGIRLTHQEFGGRATWGTNTVGDGNDSDCNGHGTHVAGTVGGKEYGVAKGTNLIAVKVLNCGGSGTWDGVIGGINWSANHHRASGKKVGVLNMSLGGGFMSAVNDATNAAVDAGIVAAVASGNSNADACNFSPASSSKAVTTNAIVVNDNGGRQEDGRSYFSNFGQCTAIFAPGTNVKSAYHTSDTATATLSGTSMAAPHVAGVAAQLISADSSLDTPAKILAQLQSTAGKDLVNMGCSSPACQQTPNLMLYSSC